MNSHVIRRPLLWSATQVIFYATSPIQRIFSQPVITHNFCNEAAIEILKKDGFTSLGNLVEGYLTKLNKGSQWADSGWKNITHFLNPETKSGLSYFPDARFFYLKYYLEAKKAWSQGDRDKAFFFLGAATHLVQDMCVPHHVLGHLFEGHSKFENWAEEHRSQFLVENEGIYEKKRSPGGWLTDNAKRALEFDYLVKDEKEVHYREATKVLLALAQRTSAGFLKDFLEERY